MFSLDEMFDKSSVDAFWDVFDNVWWVVAFVVYTEVCC